MKRTRLSVIGLIAAAGLALAGCGSASTTPASSAPAAGADTSLSDVKSAGVLKVGTEGTYKPFTFHANGSGELTGYDVEIMNAVAITSNARSSNNASAPASIPYGPCTSIAARPRRCRLSDAASFWIDTIEAA